MQPFQPQRTGLLSKLFNRGATTSSPFSFGQASTTGRSAMSMFQNINQLLGHTQKFLNVAQSFQQYGPLIRNLPSMIKIFRELQSSDEKTGVIEMKTDDEKTDAIEIKTDDTQTSTIPTRPTTIPKKKHQEKPKHSIPKLYI